MKGIITNFRGSRRNQRASNRVIVIIEGISKKEPAEKFVGKKIVWTNSKGSSISGKLMAVHGGKGALRALFEKGLPGQALGTEVKIE